MTWFAAGTAVVAVGTGISSARASEKAADVAAEGAERSGAQIQRAGDLARADVQRIFPQAQGDLLAGASGAATILGQGVTEQQRLLSAGNLGAQGTLGGGFSQVQNALLGIPVNQQAFQPQGVELSQPLQNPFGQPIGGGGVEGGLFSNLGENIAANQKAQLSDDRVAALVDRSKAEAGTLGGLSAQQRLIDLGLNRNATPLERTNLKAEGNQQLVVDGLVNLAKGQTADSLEAQERLLALGLNRFGTPLGQTAGKTAGTQKRIDTLRAQLGA